MENPLGFPTSYPQFCPQPLASASKAIINFTTSPTTTTTATKVRDPARITRPTTTCKNKSRARGAPSETVQL